MEWKVFVTEGDDYYAGTDEASIRAHIQSEIGKNDEVGELREIDAECTPMNPDDYTIADELRRNDRLGRRSKPYCVASSNC